MMNNTGFEVMSAANNASQILQYLLQTGAVDLNAVEREMKKAKREEIIKAHPHPITQGKDGRWRTRVDDIGGRRQIAKSSKEKVEDALIEFYSKKEQTSKKENVTLETLYPKWCEYKLLHEASPTYMQRINSDWHNHYEGTDIVKKPLGTLTKMDLDIWAHELIQKVNQSKKQYYNISMIMRQILDYAVDSGLIDENLLQKVKIDSRRVFDPARKKASETQVFTRLEVDELKSIAWNDFFEGHNNVHKLAPLAVMFQFQTGVRVGELCALRYEDIIENQICVQRMYRYSQKEVVNYVKGHNEGRYVTLTSAAKELIHAAKKYQQEHGLKNDGYIFSVNDEPLSYYTVKKLYARYSNMIGTAHKSSHKARKTYISTLIDEGININTIREEVGHADERTTYNSYCFDRKTKSERTKLIEKALS